MVANIITAPAGQATRVFDVADPARLGKVIKAGPEISEVRFEDGAERNIPNVPLHPVETAEVELDNPARPAEPVHTVVLQGQEAWQRLRSHSTWEDWKKVGAALVIGRGEAMRDGHVNKPKGRSYNAAINAFLKKFGFDSLDSGDRSRLFDVMDHLNEIESWLNKLPLKERLRLNHPASMLRRWKAATAEKKNSNSEQKVSPQQKLKDELVRLQEDNDRMKREIERGGGDLWSAEDRPRDIANVMFRKVGKTKAEKIARELRSLLNKKETR